MLPIPTLMLHFKQLELQLLMPMLHSDMLSLLDMPRFLMSFDFRLPLMLLLLLLLRLPLPCLLLPELMFMLPMLLLRQLRQLLLLQLKILLLCLQLLGLELLCQPVLML